MSTPAFPSLSPAVRQHMLASVLATLPTAEATTPAVAQALREAATAELAALDPQDAMEALLAAQVVAFSQASLRTMGRARTAAEEGEPADRLEASAMALAKTAAQLTRMMQQRRKAATQPVRSATEPAAAVKPDQRPQPAPSTESRRTAPANPPPAPPRTVPPAPVAPPLAAPIGVPPSVLAAPAAASRPTLSRRTDLLTSTARPPVRQAAE